MVEIPCQEITLEQNFPNPFNLSTTIVFFLAESHRVVLDTCNVQGKRVKTLLDEQRSFGKHTVKWDELNDQGSPVSSGVYYYRLKVGKQVFAKNSLY